MVNLGIQRKWRRKTNWNQWTWEYHQECWGTQHDTVGDPPFFHRIFQRCWIHFWSVSIFWIATQFSIQFSIHSIHPIHSLARFFLPLHLGSMWREGHHESTWDPMGPAETFANKYCLMLGMGTRAWIVIIPSLRRYLSYATYGTFNPCTWTIGTRSSHLFL